VAAIILPFRLAVEVPRGVTHVAHRIIPLKREPLFNVPTVVIAVLALLALIHAVRTLLLSDAQDQELLLAFAFIPERYDASVVPGGALPGGFGAEIWTFVSYSLLHASWTHLGVNALWLLPFGSAVARRFGTVRFLTFFAATAAAGAALHLATHAGAAMRFAFQRGGPVGLIRGEDEQAYRVPAITLTGMLSDARVLIFLAVWFGINILFGVGSLPLTGGDEPVAWQAHIGGFLAGMLLFSLFDPAPEELPPDEIDATRH
jgi:membrane associated rhomboid family serine protease